MSRDPTEVSWKMSALDWWAVFGASLGAFLAILDTQITNASLREIQSSLELDKLEGGWISTAYMMAEVAVIPLTGSLANIYGLRRCILLSGLLFTLSSMMCGLAWDLDSIVFFRIMQGISGGALIPLSFQTLLLHMPANMRSIGLSIFGLTATLAPTLGPTIGGFITDEFSWRWNFFLNLIPGSMMLFASYIGFPKQSSSIHTSPGGSASPTKPNYVDAVLLAVFLSAATYIFEEGAKVQWFESESIQNAALLLIVTASIFVALQFKSSRPLLDFSLLLRRSFLIATLITMCTALALFASIYSLSLYLGQVQAYTATQVGSVLMWVGVPQLVVMPLMPWIIRHVDARALIIAGLILFAWSNYLNADISSSYSGEAFRVSLVIRALGQPLVLVPLSLLGMSVILPSESSSASALFNVFRNLGGSMGIALTNTLLTNQQASHQIRFTEQSGLDVVIAERLTAMQYYFRQHGMDAIQSQVAAAAALRGASVKQAFVQSFADVYYSLTWVVVCCVALSFFLPRKRSPILSNHSLSENVHESAF